MIFLLSCNAGSRQYANTANVQIEAKQAQGAAGSGSNVRRQSELEINLLCGLGSANCFLQTSDGNHKSYYVKKVNRDTLGWRAGILAGDKIIKVYTTQRRGWRLMPRWLQAKALFPAH